MTELTSLTEKIKILYIDDDIELIAIYIRFFETTDYDFKTANDAESGYELAKSFIPDLIISDVTMPGLSGLDLCRKIRKDPVLENVIFMLLSGHEIDAEDIIEGLNAGADDYLLKPFMRDVLFAKIKSQLRTKKLKDELQYADNMVEKLNSQYTQVVEELNTTKEILSEEKELLFNSLKQITLMTEKEKRNDLEIESLKDQIRNNNDNFITMLSELIEAKPQFHRGHSVNVSKVVESIATMLELSKKEVDDIKTAGLLHELGRISIPEELATKSYNDYSQSERDLLVQHPVKGAKLLRMFPEFDNIGKIIRHIHENVDGTGFPNGLKKKKIPLGSKIISVVNAFDNIMYRNEKISAEKSFEILEESVGSKYDSLVVNCLRRFVNRHSIDTNSNYLEMRLYEVKPGMQLAAGVYTLKGAKLLPENTVLTEDNIKKIAQYNKIDLLEETLFIKG